MIKEILKKTKPSLSDKLPRGAQAKLAEKFSLSRQTIANALNGSELVLDDTMAKVVKAAIKIIEKEGKKNIAYIDKLNEKLAAASAA